MKTFATIVCILLVGMVAGHSIGGVNCRSADVEQPPVPIPPGGHRSADFEQPPAPIPPGGRRSADFEQPPGIHWEVVVLLISNSHLEFHREVAILLILKSHLESHCREVAVLLSD